ncbi:four helix bundle protein [Lysobacteraceae bacterium NML07-0707]|nr:four helix bundle protein [Xanthomonadaceae bacterium NML07-0707]
MSISHFRELEVWQLAMALAKQVYQAVSGLPREERYGLSAQLQRSAVSIPSNIAEGNARASLKDYLRFISIAQGSCAELQTQLLLSIELFPEVALALQECLSTCNRVGQMLLRLHQALSQRLDAESRIPSSESRTF